jgi:hypothetical protein
MTSMTIAGRLKRRRGALQTGCVPHEFYQQNFDSAGADVRFAPFCEVTVRLVRACAAVTGPCCTMC